MSARLLGIAWACDMGTPQRKLLLLKGIDCCDDDGSNIFPSVETMAAAAQCSDRTVQRELRTFVRVGLYEVDEEGGRGPKSTTHYRLSLTALKRISKIGWDAYCAEKGDTESPSPRCKGDSDDIPRVTDKASKGDTMSHPTPQDPSTDPLQREARARNRPDRRRLYDRFRELARRYPGAESDQIEKAERIWYSLTEEKRCLAEELLDCFIAAIKKSKRRPPIQEYLSEEKWDFVRDDAPGMSAADGDASTHDLARQAAPQRSFVRKDDPRFEAFADRYRRELGTSPTVMESPMYRCLGAWIPSDWLVEPEDPSGAPG